MLDKFKTICEILAYISAAVFFIFKAYSGAFYVSLSLTLSSDKRRKLNEKEDLLIIDLGLTGGENALLDIYKIEGRISYDNSKPIEIKFKGIERLTIKDENKELEIISPWESYTAYKYHISLKETTSFAEQLIVPKDSICYIEIIVVGKRKKFKWLNGAISQWRISHIALPNQT